MGLRTVGMCTTAAVCQKSMDEWMNEWKVYSFKQIFTFINENGHDIVWNYVLKSKWW